MLKLQPVGTGIIVCWEMPKSGTFKLNINGSHTPSTGKAGWGGVLRAYNGNMFMFFSQPVDSNSYIMAEVQSAKFGIDCYVQNGYKEFTLELDSLEVIHMIIEQQAKI